MPDFDPGGVRQRSIAGSRSRGRFSAGEEAAACGVRSSRHPHDQGIQIMMTRTMKNKKRTMKGMRKTTKRRTSGKKRMTRKPMKRTTTRKTGMKRTTARNWARKNMRKMRRNASKRRTMKTYKTYSFSSYRTFKRKAA
jgi:hypothetical protein